MASGRFKSLLVAGFSGFLLLFCIPAVAQEDSAHKEVKKTFDAKEIIFGHVLNSHDFHIIDIIGEKMGRKHPVSIPLPVILYSKQRGSEAFMSSRFHHGEENYRNYMLLTDEKIRELKLDPTKYNAQDIVAVNDAGEIDPAVRIYDISLAQCCADVYLDGSVHLGHVVHRKRYRSGQGVKSAPKGSQSLLNPSYHFCKG
jgi:F-type H+-transporting ATPase subunit a